MQTPPKLVRFIRFTALGAVLLGTALCDDLFADCVTPPAGLVSWWPAEGTAADIQGTNNGTFTGALYGQGEVGQAFSFDGSGNNVRIPASPVMDIGAGSGMTIEAWVFSTDNTYGRPIAEWVPKSAGTFATHFYLHQTAPGVLYANLFDTTGHSHIIQTPAGLVTTNVYHHVAVTYDKTSSNAVLFLDGNVVAQSTLGLFTPQTSPDLSIGLRPSSVPFGPVPFYGRIDEVSLYSRALATNEVRAIYDAGAAGKCQTAPPTITIQPTNQTVWAGTTATFSVLAIGAQPLSYQWTMDGTNLVNQTNALLTIANAQTTDAGIYAVQVTNSFGTVTSSNAVLVVNIPPACAGPPSGIAAWWQGEANANDLVGPDAGNISSITFVPGMVGQAFNFDGVSSSIIVPASPRLNVQDLTVETWIYPTDVSRPRPIVEFANATGYSMVNFWYGLGNGAQPVSGALFAAARDGVTLNTIYVASAGGVLPPNQWSHLAFTFDSVAGKAVLFVNGVGVATNTFVPNIHPNTQVAVNLGYRPVGSSDLYAGARHAGKLDEVTLYNRVLSQGDLQAIYNANVAGKCLTPIAPSIVSQPANETIGSGTSTFLTVAAAGTMPLYYQWTVNGTNLVGATTDTLAITNAQVSQSGTYAVLVTNLAGSLTSSNAILTVTPPPPCVAPPSGLVAWWAGEGNANDNEGANNGFFTGPQYASGEVGQGFSFDASGNNVRIIASPVIDVGAGAGMTIEAWINPADTSGRPVAEWVPSTVGAFGAHLWVNEGGPGAVYLNLYDGSASHIIQSPDNVILANTNQHIAVTYDKSSGVARLFVQGAKVAESNLGTFTPFTSSDLVLGLRPSTVPFGPTPFLGTIDEFSLYSRALAPQEIQAIYNAGSSGKCNVPVPPTIFVQPTDQTTTIGQLVIFSVQAGGTAPLAYQWSLGTNAIVGATSSVLALTNVQMSQAGMYSVVVTNLYGSVTSSNAALVVNFPPAAVNVVSTSGGAGEMVTVPVMLVANGNENAVGFSLNFSPTQLTNIGVTLGSGATGGSLQFNSGAAGTVGIAVALPSGSTFAPGTQEVAEVSFVSAISTSAYSVLLTFGDSPTKSELSDAKANPLQVNFNGGQVSLTRSSFEGDVSPRPDGDGALSIVDWVQVGRYVAALDSPTNASEFQRADCAPRSSAGDGLLTVSDWVQAGRYAAGLDQPALAAGPTVPSGHVIAPQHKDGSSTSRTITVQGPLLFQGQTATAVIALDAQGDENAVGLSLSFDPKVVTYTGTLLGTDATSATIDVNANAATNGQLGIILALPNPTASFPAGTRQLVKVSFQAVTPTSLDSPVTLTDLPVRREVADTNALPVAANYTNGVIEVNPRPSLTILQANQTVNLAWPLWATNYNLQQAIATTAPLTTWTNLPLAPVVTNNALGVTVPLSGSAQFYRLQHQ